MEKVKRNERVAAMARILTESPNQVFTLSHFCAMFDAAKSTVSEDVELLREVYATYGLGGLTTITGAAGGVVYIPQLTASQAQAFARELCAELSLRERVLLGGLLYNADIVTSPRWMQRAGVLLAGAFRDAKPDFVLTVETSGISIALMTAQALGVPVVLARRDHSAYDGSVVTINYRSGSGALQTMSLSRRAAKPGQRALIVDDFMKAGGTAHGLIELMGEFDAAVVGVGLLMMTREPVRKFVQDARSIVVLDGIDEDGARVSAAPWIEAGGGEA